MQKLQRLFEKNLPLFSALGDPVRQQLIMLMMRGEHQAVTELAAQTSLSRPTISHHLKVLKNAHIVGEQKVGTRIYYFPQMGEYFGPLKELVDEVAALDMYNCREEGWPGAGKNVT